MRGVTGTSRDFAGVRSLRNAHARRNLKSAGWCVALLYERRKGRLKDAFAHCVFASAFVAAF